MTNISNDQLSNVTGGTSFADDAKSYATTGRRVPRRPAPAIFGERGFSRLGGTVAASANRRHPRPPRLAGRESTSPNRGQRQGKRHALTAFDGHGEKNRHDRRFFVFGILAIER